MKSLRSLAVGIAATALIVGAAYSGIFNFPSASLTADTATQRAATLPMTGAECFAGDTNLSGGRAPQTACYNQGNLKGNYNVDLTDAATISWNMVANANMYTISLAGNRTMAAPTNQTTGQVTYLLVKQTGGSNTITWNSVFKWPATTAGGQPAAPTLTTTAGRADLFMFISDGTNMWGQPQSIGTASQNRVP